MTLDPPVNLTSLRSFPRTVFNAVSRSYDGKATDDKEFGGVLYRPLPALGRYELLKTTAGALAWSERQSEDNLSFGAGVSLLPWMPCGEGDLGVTADFRAERLLHLSVGMRLDADCSIIGYRSYILRIIADLSDYKYSEYPQFLPVILDMLQMMNLLPKKTLFTIREKVSIPA